MIRSSQQNRLVSEGQKNFIRTLLAEREVPQAARDIIFENAKGGMTSTQASDYIRILKDLPFKGGVSKAVRDNTPAELGAYVLGGEIYAVREWTPPGKTEKVRFARRGEFRNEDHEVVSFASTAGHRVEWVPAPGYQFKLASGGRKLSLEEVTALSIQFDNCFICGHKLEVKKSKERGIGPDCIKKVSFGQAPASHSPFYESQERYDGEDLPGGVAYEGARELAKEYITAMGTEPTEVEIGVVTRAILSDEDGEFSLSLRETIYDATH